MSKIADALNDIQKNQENRSGRNSVFVNTVDEKLRPRSRYEAVASVMMVLRPLVLLASVAVVLVVFSYGVRQGMKIEKAIANTTEDAAAASESAPLASEGPEYYLPDAPAEDTVPGAPALEGNPSVTVQPVTAAPVTVPDASVSVPAETAVPAQPSQPEPPTAAPAVQEGKYTVQLITYVGQPRASEEVEKLKKKGYAPFVIPSGRHHQVCINRFPSKAAAADFLKQAAKDGLLETYPGAYVRVSNS